MKDLSFEEDKEDHDEAFGNFIYKCPLYTDLALAAQNLDLDEGSEDGFDFSVAHPDHEPLVAPPPPEPLYVPSPFRAGGSGAEMRGEREEVGNGGQEGDGEVGEASPIAEEASSVHGPRAGPAAGAGAHQPASSSKDTVAKKLELGKAGPGKAVSSSKSVFRSAPVCVGSAASGTKREVRAAVPVNKSKVKMDAETEKMLKEFNEAQKKKKERKELDLFDDDTLAIIEAFNNEVAEAGKSQSDRVGVTTRSGRRGGGAVAGGSGGVAVNAAPNATAKTSASAAPGRAVITPPSAAPAVSRSKPIQVAPAPDSSSGSQKSSAGSSASSSTAQQQHVPRQPLLPKAAGVRPQQHQASAVSAPGAKKHGATSFTSGKGSKRPQEEDMDPEILAMLSAHNKKFKPEPSYVPQKHTVAEIKVWEEETGKTWHSLSGSEREAVNDEISFRKARGVLLRT